MNGLIDQLMRPPAPRVNRLRDQILLENRPGGPVPVFNLNAEPFYPPGYGRLDNLAGINLQLPRQL